MCGRHIWKPPFEASDLGTRQVSEHIEAERNLSERRKGKKRGEERGREAGRQARRGRGVTDRLAE